MKVKWVFGDVLEFQKMGESHTTKMFYGESNINVTERLDRLSFGLGSSEGLYFS